MGFVYVIEEPKTQTVKIGSTENLHERIRILQSSNPNKFGRIWQSENLPNYVECEKLIHKHLSKYRGDGGTEWYKMPYEVACKESETICINGKITSLILENQMLKEQIKKLQGEYTT
jgi:hypothetical protein